jgi:hypothetical protein
MQDGDDHVECNGNAQLIAYGDDGDDLLIRGSNGDYLIGGSGSDILLANDGADYLEGRRLQPLPLLINHPRITKNNHKKVSACLSSAWHLVLVVCPAEGHIICRVLPDHATKYLDSG